MSTELEVPEDIEAGGGEFLTEPGFYHLRVLHCEDAPDGWKVQIVVMEGESKDKSTTLTLFNPKITDKEGGLFSKKKRARFAEAVGLFDPSIRGKTVSINLPDAIDRQFVAELELGEPKENGKRYLNWAYANIFHVDDPKVAKIPKNEAALKLLPQSLRRKPESFAKPGATGSPASPGNGTTTGATPTTPPNIASGDDLGSM